MPSRMRRPRGQPKGHSGGKNRERKENPVQKLYDACRASFLSPDSPNSLQQLKLILDSIKSEDVGLAEESLAFENLDLGPSGIADNDSSTDPPIYYLGIHDCKEFSIGVFCLSQSAVIPLHDHPGMTVLSKLVYGSMHVKAYDWIGSRPSTDSPQSGFAKLVKDEVISAPCEISVLYPSSGGNLHTFSAITPCAVLDVLSPPYSEEEDRDCTYYHDTPLQGIPVAGFEEENLDSKVLGVASLNPIPLNFTVTGLPYRGRHIKKY